MDEARAKLERRLNRRELWASLWLKRILAFLDFFNGETLPAFWRKRADVWITHLTQTVLDIVLSRALLVLLNGRDRGLVRRQTPQPSLRPAFRRLIGAALRRALKAKALKARAQRILRVLCMRDSFVAKLAHRLRRVLGRARANAPRRTIGGDVAIAPALFSTTRVSADTS